MLVLFRVHLVELVSIKAAFYTGVRKTHMVVGASSVRAHWRVFKPVRSMGWGALKFLLGNLKCLFPLGRPFS